MNKEEYMLKFEEYAAENDTDQILRLLKIRPTDANPVLPIFPGLCHVGEMMKILIEHKRYKFLIYFMSRYGYPRKVNDEYNELIKTLLLFYCGKIECESDYIYEPKLSFLVLDFLSE